MLIKKGLTRFVLLWAFIGLLIVFFLSEGRLFAQEWRRSLQKEKPTFAQIQEHFYKYWSQTSGKRRGGWKQFKRWEWFVMNRLDSEGYFNPSLNWSGWLEKEARFGHNTDLSAATSAAWVQVGPIQLPELYNQEGYPGMGRLNCLAFHPNNPNIIWVGAPSGGLWRSNDDGATWTNLTDHLPNLGVSSILIHPLNPDIMYIATGDGDSYDTFSIGVLKSTDGGTTWNTTGFTTDVSANTVINKMIMHPANPDIILAATRHGMLKTVNGGQSWTQKATGDFKDIDVDPVSPATWYATASEEGIFKSEDSGDSWGKKTVGLPANGFGRIALAVSRSSRQIVYAIFTDSEDGFFGLFCSIDGGNTWALRSNTPNLLGWEVAGDDSGGQGWYDLTIDIDLNNPNVIYVGGVNMWKSMDGGTSWNIIGHWYGAAGVPYVHADHHSFNYHPQNGNIIYVGNDGGLFKSSDAGNTWRDLSSGLAIHQVYRLGASARDAGTLIVGTQDNGSDIFLNGAWKSAFGGDGMECAIDPITDATMYCSVYNGSFYRSNNYGRTWSPISGEFEDEGAWVTPFQIDPQNPAILYTVSTRVYKSINRGSSWTAISNELDNVPLKAMAVAPSNSQFIYVAGNNHMFVTQNNGGSWKNLPEATLPLNITAIAVHPQQPTTIWVTCGRYLAGRKVYYSTDSGDTWINISGLLPNIPVNCITLDGLSNTVYIGTDLGVFYAPPGSASWQTYNTGLPNVIVNDLEININSNTLLAATFGRGVWQSPLADAPAVYPPSDFNGQRGINHSFLQKEYLDMLSWSTNPANQDKHVAQYLIYRLEDGIETLIHTANANTFQYAVRKVENRSYNYCISTLDEEGNESPKTCIAVN